MGRRWVVKRPSWSIPDKSLALSDSKKRMPLVRYIEIYTEEEKV